MPDFAFELISKAVILFIFNGGTDPPSKRKFFFVVVLASLSLLTKCNMIFC